ncbi:unnamed protein product [Linum trigynum]|uniref:Uncharacterized protein n=1 Tax=Linum trigynum TaxID=586398 RepID=A0AAV2EWB6_9ROSI
MVFGDSLVDSGNNNYVDTTLKADLPPYGIDSPTGRPTGRFCNGRNFADLISEVLKLPESPSPFLSPQLSGERLLYGANFASGGVGISNDTGIQLGNIIRMPEQIASLERYRTQLAAVVGGKEEARKLVNRALFFISLGTWDLVGNYFSPPFSARAGQSTVADFIDYLISEYAIILRRLVELGARRVLVLGPGQLGCLPVELAIRGRGSNRATDCGSEIQTASLLFNSQLTQITQQLNRELGSDVYVAANRYMMAYNFINNPDAYGFTETGVACCGQGPYNGVGQCTPASNLCSNRDEYVYWDPYHPTERSAEAILEVILTGPPDVISPINLNTMMAANTET